MSMPSDVPELAARSEAAIDEAETTRCLEEAARMVQEFSAAGGPSSLNALLAVAGETPDAAVAQALELAETVTTQTATLHSEVAHFLSVTRDG